jgi:DNA-binding MurR/RpiR family transcriptional regulator
MDSLAALPVRDFPFYITALQAERKGHMEAPRDFEALKQRLVEIEPDLPKRLKQTAAFALQHPDEIALGTASGVARRAHVQASTLVRFAQALGFAGFTELQGVFRVHLRNRWPEYPERLKALHARAADPYDPMSLLLGFSESAQQSVSALRAEIDGEALAAAVEILAGARIVFLLAQRRSFCVAHYLAYAFAQLGVAALLVDDVGGLGREQLGVASPEDAALAVSFAPYSPVTLALTEAARARNAKIVAITDSALSPLAALADRRLEVVERDFGAFRSLGATFCLAMTLAVAVAERRAR